MYLEISDENASYFALMTVAHLLNKSSVRLYSDPPAAEFLRNTALSVLNDTVNKCTSHYSHSNLPFILNYASELKDVIRNHENNN